MTVVDWLPDFVRILLAALLASAALAKIRKFRRFSDYLSKSAFGDRMATIVNPIIIGAAVIGSEIVIAAALATGIAATYSAAAAVVLIYGFSAFLATQYLRRGPTRCECWAALWSGSHVSPVNDRVEPQEPSEHTKDILAPVGQAIRNTLFCAGAIHVARDGEMGILLNVLVAAPVVLLFLTALAIAIVAERRKLRRRIHPRYDALSEILAPLVVLDYYRAAPGVDRGE